MTILIGVTVQILLDGTACSFQYVRYCVIGSQFTTAKQNSWEGKYKDIKYHQVRCVLTYNQMIQRLSQGLTHAKRVSHFVSDPSRYDNQTVNFAPYPHWYLSVLHFFQASASWENIWMLNWGSRDALCGKPSCTLFRGVHLKSYIKKHVTISCGSVCTCTPLHVELFICWLYFLTCFIWGNTAGQAKKTRLLKVGMWSSYPDCDKQSLTWHFIAESL